MAFILADRVRETTTTTGTGSITLAGAVAGYQSFSAGIGLNNTTYYTIADQSGNNWEVGLGTVTSGVLSRDVILSSSNSNAVVTFTAGTKDVFCDYPAYSAVTQKDVGTAANQIPLNQYLGTMAYEDTNAVVLTGDAKINTLTVGLGSGSVATNTATGYQALLSNTAGSGNVSNGYQAGNKNTTGSNNSYFGYQAGYSNTTGSANVAIGYQANNNAAVGTSNIAIGYQSSSNSTASANGISLTSGGSGYNGGASSGSFFAVQTSYVSGPTATVYPIITVQVTAGVLSYSFGNGGSGFTASGTVLTVTSAAMVAAGAAAGGSGAAFTVTSISGSNSNVAIGYQSLNGVGSPSFNVAVGAYALSLITSGFSNTAIGYNALVKLTGGYYNIGIGNGAAGNLTSGAQNTALGNSALASATTQNNLTGLGYQAGYSLIAADTYGSLYAGFQAGYYNTTGVDNVFLGGKAGYGVSSSTTGGKNVAIGTNAMGVYTTGNSNVVIGYQAGQATTTATANVVIGYQAGSAITTGGGIIAIGYQALQQVTTQQRAVAMGFWAGQQHSATDTYGSVYIGYNAGVYNGSGADNVFIGGQAGNGAIGSTTGGKNVAIGGNAMGLYTTGTQNTAVGYQAGSTLTTGSNNILLGYQSAPSAVTVSNEITIGNSSNTVIRYPHSYSTVASLPSASTVGRGSRTFVTDALAPVFQATVAGGGAVFTPVYSDGSVWKVG